jgi:hypothetical protein
MIGHVWSCICGRPWNSDEHTRKLNLTGGRWRGDPFRLDPWDQWCREQLPNGHCGVVYCADDGILRSFNPNRKDDLGMWAKVEAKSHMAEPTWADIQTLRAVKRGTALSPLVIRYDSDVPTQLHHWPTPCTGCGAPGSVPQPSTTVVVNIIGGYRCPSRTVKMRPAGLRPYLLAYFQHPEP